MTAEVPDPPKKPETTPEVVATYCLPKRIRHGADVAELQEKRPTKRDGHGKNCESIAWNRRERHRRFESLPHRGLSCFDARLFQLIPNPQGSCPCGPVFRWAQKIKHCIDWNEPPSRPRKACTAQGAGTERSVHGQLPFRHRDGRDFGVMIFLSPRAAPAIAPRLHLVAKPCAGD